MASFNILELFNISRIQIRKNVYEYLDRLLQNISSEYNGNNYKEVNRRNRE